MKVTCTIGTWRNTVYTNRWLDQNKHTQSVRDSLFLTPFKNLCKFHIYINKTLHNGTVTHLINRDYIKNVTNYKILLGAWITCRGGRGPYWREKSPPSHKRSNITRILYAFNNCTSSKLSEPSPQQFPAHTQVFQHYLFGDDKRNHTQHENIRESI